MDPVGDAGPDRRRERRRPGRGPRPLSTGAPGCLHLRVGGAGEVDDGIGLHPDLVADRCWLLGATAIAELPDRIEPEVLLEVGFETVVDAAAAAVDLAARWPTLSILEVDAAPALAAALEAWKPHARPLRIGRLHIRPAWLADDDEPPSADEVVVRVDPTTAFGFDHPSTTLCLDAVESLVHLGSSFLDVGCGSGILAVAAARLGAAPVVALDVAEAAVAATRSAAAANGVEVHASAAPVGEERGRFDLVVANIGAGTLTDLAPAIAARVAGGGHLVLAGLLAEHAAGVEASYAAHGLRLVSTGERSGWVSPVFLRESTTSPR